MAIKISNFFNYQNNNSKIGDFQDLEHIDGVSISATTANLYNIKRDDVVMFYFRKGAEYASVYTQSKIISENIKWNLNIGNRKISCLRYFFNDTDIKLFKYFFSTNYDVRGKNQRHIYTLFNWCKEKYSKKHIYFTRCFNRNEWCINWFIFWYYDLFSATRNWLCKNQFTKLNN